jgi:hypothetical protein
MTNVKDVQCHILYMLEIVKLNAHKDTILMKLSVGLVTHLVYLVTEVGIMNVSPVEKELT